MFLTQWVLGKENATDALTLRREVWVNELQRSDVFDEEDALAAHLIVYLDREPIASARFRPYQNGVKLEYAAVKRAYRHQGFGDLLTRVMLDKARRMGTPRVYVDVGDAHIPYYKAFGFVAEGVAVDGSTRLFVEPERIDWHPGCGAYEYPQNI